MTFGQNLSLQQLIQMRDRAADRCVETLAQPDLDVIGSKGTSPREAAKLSAWVVVISDKAIKARLAGETANDHTSD